MYSDQGYSSDFVNWTKQVCLQTRLKWWQWWGTSDIIWNSVPDRRRSKWKWTITKCCLTVCRSIEKRHGVWAGASVAGVQWLSMQQTSDIWWCSTAVAVVAQTSYFVSATYFARKPMKWFYVYGYTRLLWKAQDYSSCIVLYSLQVGCHIMSRTKQQWVTVVTFRQNKSRYKCGSCSTCQDSTNRCQTTQFKVASMNSVLLSLSLSMFAVAKALTSLIHDCIEWSSSDILSGGADICNCKSSANEWCMIVWVNNGRQRLNIHGEMYRAKNWTLRNTWVYMSKSRAMIS